MVARQSGDNCSGSAGKYHPDESAVISVRLSPEVYNPATICEPRTSGIALDNISQLLRAWSDGDQLALGELTPVVYAELHRLAHRDMRRPVTVRRDWNRAKIWLYRELTGETVDGPGSLETAR